MSGDNMLEQKLLKKIRQLNKKLPLIENKDHILIGLSGGKDSLVLLYLLNKLRQYHIYDFKLSACMVDVGFEDMDPSDVKSFCDKMDINLEIINSDILFIISHYEKNEKISCARCSNLKRGALVNYAKSINANKIALGHNLDDVVETLIMNIINSGKDDTFKAKLYYPDNDITFIRPLLLCEEQMIKTFANNEKLPILKSTCPNDKTSRRADTKKLVSKLYSLYPEAEKNLAHLAIQKSLQIKS